jgi:hypothetical protein
VSYLDQEVKSMSRRLVFTTLVSTVVTLAVSFGVASYASGSSERPGLRPELPVAQLPTFSLDEVSSVKINNLIGAPGVARFGITPASYTQVRRLASTRVGAFYLVPGSSGACVVGPYGAACGDPGASGQEMLALVEATADGTGVVGAGISTAATKRIVLQRRDGSPPVSLPVVRGVFVLNESAGIRPSQLVRLNFVAR